MRAEGVIVTVPKGAEQMLFLAPKPVVTSTLRTTVRGKPGAVRAARIWIGQAWTVRGSTFT